MVFEGAFENELPACPDVPYVKFALNTIRHDTSLTHILHMVACLAMPCHKYCTCMVMVNPTTCNTSFAVAAVHQEI
jgi:hypothetical protein